MDRDSPYSADKKDSRVSKSEKIGKTLAAPNVGDKIAAHNAAWNFSGNVSEFFTEHVRRSVPFYEVGHDLVCRISDFFITSPSGSVCYELGTSTATLLTKLVRHNQHKKHVRWVGIDCIPEMIQEAKRNTGELENIELVLDDIVTYDYEPSDFIVAYLTVEFIPPRLRQELINKIYGTLNWGGGFVMFSKVRAPDARFHDMMTALYNEFKTEQGFTGDEIVNKARSLKGVLEPFSTEGNLGLLRRAGFEDIMTIMKYVCFECFLAIK